MNRYKKNNSEMNNQAEQNYFEGSNKEYFDYLNELKSSKNEDFNDNDYDSVFMIF